ncbi:cytospin-A [Syngnathus scovelli]|uniref:cytospin-A n=1 Tax=Syngnathus scovelli TaxID=161590 RepID=UPI00210FDEC8|nr:cytospin-A [Syngnathus scovelli]XP_049613188.1 cytospin-A [Syngnathus scovelli]XP_049613189.1 cytospin-A [Syngnathus scovelli]
MGNMNYRSSAGSPLEFFQALAMPSETDLAALAMSSASFANRSQTPSLKMAANASQGTTLAVEQPSEWSVLSKEKSSDERGEEESHDEAPAINLCSLTSQNSSRVWPLEQSWQEKDSGLETQAAAERSGEELSRALLGLMERHRTMLGLNFSTEAVELVRHLITERDKLAEDVNILQETLKNEKSEWEQFQLDLLATVSAAERMRTESEQALIELQEDRRCLQQQLAQTHEKLLETQRELQRLRSKHTDKSFQLSSLEKKQEKMDGRFTEDKSNPAGCHEIKMEKVDVGSVKKQEEHEASDEKDAQKSATTQLTARGRGKAYVDALQKKNGGASDPKKTLMSSERNVPRLQLPLDSHNNNSIKTTSTLPSPKREEPTRGRKLSHLLKRQDNLSGCQTVLVETVGDSETSSKPDVLSYASKLQMEAAYTKPLLGKQEENTPSDVVIKPPESTRAPPRRHSSTRQVMLNQCQSRTKGYQHIEITNFSTCWVDGLAFCALYHNYLPSRIPYNSLNPAEKKENLNLAFRTGESIGIKATLSVDEMLTDEGPDWHKVLRYVESIFHHFEMKCDEVSTV